ncbi:MAG TPA: carboxypeptidase regulatory-like domain-containing protein [Terriglobales bacterium]|nr:carboxypeptidase regulatory-like domain-containing protein [Terriglobales bacterium]
MSFLALWCAIGHAQAPVTLKVTVNDENGVAQRSARVSLQLAGSAALFKQETDFSGRCQFPSLPAGAYLLHVEKEGFYAVNETLQISAATGAIEIELHHLQEVKEEVNVVESPPAIDPEKITDTRSLSGLDIINIPYPITRDYRNILPFIPGVVLDSSGQPHVAGGHTYQTLDTLDGFDITDPVNGTLQLRVSTDALRSIDVQTSRYSAEYGRSSAGVLNLGTGIGDDHLRYTGTNFLPSFKFVRGVNLDKWTPRFTVSGPLKKGKAWFYEAEDFEYDYNLIPDLPAGADQAPLWRFSNLVKLQTNITRSNILTGSFLFNRFKYSHAGLSLFNPLNATTNQDQTGYFASFKDQHYFANGTLLENGLALFEQELDVLPLGNLPFIQTPGLLGGNFYRTTLDRSRRLQWISNVYLRPHNWHGSHEFKFGMDADRVAYHEFNDRTPIRVFDETGALLRQTLFPGQTVALRKNNLQGSAYAQDRWSPSNRLVIESGVRFDADEIIRQILVSPRVAGTYMLTSDGETKLSAGFGVFYDATNLSLVSQPLSGTRLDYYYASTGALLRPPVLTQFFLNQNTLREPRFLNWSASVERRLPGDVYFSVEYLDRRGNNGFVYLPQPAAAGLTGGAFVMSNTRQDHSHSLQFIARHTFRKAYPLMVSYTHSRSVSNAVLTYSLDSLSYGLEGPGPYPWDAPNRVLLWGMAPLPSLPLIHKLDFAYSLDYRTGYPFSLLNQEQQFLQPLNNMRFPRFFSFSPYIEKRFTLRRYNFALRGGFDNVTSSRNPTAVNNNINSPNFLAFSNFDRRAFVARIRFLGKKK